MCITPCNSNWKSQLFLQKLLEGFITRKEEICALVADYLAGLPDDMKRFLDFEGLMGTAALKMECEVWVHSDSVRHYSTESL